MKPVAISSLINELGGELVASIPNDENSQPNKQQWTEDCLWQGIPEEFHGATLLPSLLAILNDRPRSFALVGPPGTGKTRTLWAMAHSARRVRFLKDGYSFGAPINRLRIDDGQYDNRNQSVSEAVCAVMGKIDRVKIITEVGDIRSHRYDHAYLAQMASDRRWLAIDDIGAIEPNEWVREALYHLANERRSHGLHTIWTSNLTTTQLRDTFGGAIASRILGGQVVEVGGKDRRLE